MSRKQAQFYTFFSRNYDNYSMFWDFPGCSGMFWDVPCSWFYRRPKFGARSSLKKKIFPAIFHPGHSFKCSLLDEKIVYQSFYGVLLTFSYILLQGKVLCFGTHRQVTCEILIFKCLYGVPTLPKKSISPVIFDTNRSFKR